MNILLIGSSGLLGRKIFETIRQVRKLHLFHNGIKKRKYNLEKINNHKKINIKSKPNLIINALGFTNIDLCEKDKKSYLVNVEIINNIFILKKKFKLKFNFIQFSTDQIYDSRSKKFNKENSLTVINNKYSKQKLDAEKIIDVFLKDLETYMNNNSLNENEVKLGLALLDLFDNYGDVFIDNNNNKFNKNVVLFFLRENTNLNTKEIRVYLKKYKVLYLDTLRRLNNQ